MGWSNDIYEEATLQTVETNGYPWKYTWEYVPDTTVRVQPGWEETSFGSDGEVRIDTSIYDALVASAGKIFTKNKFSGYTLQDSELSVEKDFKESDDMKKFLDDIRK